MRYFFLAALLWAGALQAQTYPDYQSLTVNDYADLLPDRDEAALSARLSTLRTETGVEMTVVTLRSQAPYSQQTLAQFAGGLFNEWGIGDAARNDGVLVLVLHEDRAMRIELGAAYGRVWDPVAADIIDDHFLDAFAAGDYPRGIREGSAAVIEEIVMPYLSDAPPPAQSGPGFAGYVLIALVILGFALAAAGRQIGDALARFRTCPRCRMRGLRQTSRTITSPTYAVQGRGERRRHCPNCSYDQSFPYVIPRLTRNNSSGGGSGRFGGGRSGGGGASGRW